MEQSAKTLTPALGRVINSIVVGHQTGENFLPIYVQNARKLSTKPMSVKRQTCADLSHVRVMFAVLLCSLLCFPSLLFTAVYL